MFRRLRRRSLQGALPHALPAISLLRRPACGLALLIGVAPAFATSQEVAFLIRHAERAEGEDPAITKAGRERARRWAEMLGKSGIVKIFTSEARRTRETGGIIAKALGVEAEALPTGDTQALMDLLEWYHEDERVLIVGHTETIPGLLAALGAEGMVEMPKDDYARLFVVLRGENGTVLLDMAMP